MHAARPLPYPRFAPQPDAVSTDLQALAHHMDACDQSRGRFFLVRSAMERAHALASPRIVTTAALSVVCALALLAVV